jgi:hypothetical protein
MRRIIRLTIFIIVIAGAAWFWKSDSQLLKNLANRILIGAVSVYQKIIHKDVSAGSVGIVSIPDKTIIWCDSGCFWLGRDGMIFSEAPKTEGSLVKTAKTSLGVERKIGDQALSPAEAENLYAIASVMKKFDFNFSSMDLGDLSLKEAIITIASGTKFYFSLKFPPEFTVPVIESLIKSGEINNLQYIDFRMENRAYYK